MPESSDGRQKREERALFEQFARLLSGMPVGEITQPPPPEPDVIVETEAGLFGIEITQPRPSTPADRQNEGEQDGIVSAAARFYEALGGPPVHVRVHWSAGSTVSKRERQLLAESLAVLVRQRLPAQNDTVEMEAAGEPYDELPRQVSLLQISRSEIYRRSHWDAPRGAFVPASSREEIEERLRAKETRLAGYRNAYREIWLLLAVETGGPSTWRVVPEWLLAEHFETRFDRAFILESKHNRVSELLVRKPEGTDHAPAG